MDDIRLPGGIWRIDTLRPLGSPGGFGAVFIGESEGGDTVAIKRLHLGATDAAHRELSIAEELRSVSSDHVVSVLDAGQDSDSDRYFIVMPVADESLQDYLAREGLLPDTLAAEILGQIATGLADIPGIVHRDLKPANVLSLDGFWQVADFGIARFVEASTSSRTLREALTPAFAAPEQWRLERATAGTDVYALGCITYVMLTGSPPFKGSIDEIREGHLNVQPSTIANAQPALRSLVSMMLRKAPGARPGLDRLRTILANVTADSAEEPDPALNRLGAAAARHEEEISEAEAALRREVEEGTQRKALAEEAKVILEGCFEELAVRISDAVPGASTTKSHGSHKIHVAGAALELDVGDSTSVIAADAFPRSEWDVICGAAIQVTDGRGNLRSASLWYTRQKWPANEPRWYEVGYRGNALAGKGFTHEPTAVTIELADRAHSPAMDVVLTSYPPTPIDDEDLAAFCSRWILILSAAAEQRLERLPGSLPSIE